MLVTGDQVITSGNAANTEARERVLEAAEMLFAKKGYTAVTLRDIAEQIGVKHTSLYHHVPGGKEQLFIEVTERTLKRHHEGLERAIQGANDDLERELSAAARWLLNQPPMDLVRMVYSDMPALDPREAERLSRLAYESMFSPVENALRRAAERGEIEHPHLGTVAAALVGLFESLHATPKTHVTADRGALADELVAVMLNGLRKR